MELLKKLINKKVILVAVCLLIFFFGFLLGRITKTEQNSKYNLTASISEESAYRDAYAKGWICYMNWKMSDPPQYYSSYVYGRKYNNTFTSNRDAFYAGFDDAFYTDYNRDPIAEIDSSIIERREKDYSAYYGEG